METEHGDEGEPSYGVGVGSQDAAGSVVYGDVAGAGLPPCVVNAANTPAVLLSARPLQCCTSALSLRSL